MLIVDGIIGTVRYFFESKAFLSQTITHNEARRIVEEQFARREAGFFEILESVYANHQSPYYRLLRHAGIELSDIKRLVAEKGLEATLEHLLDAGVYVTQEELKGRTPVRRTGLEFKTSPKDFDNPLGNESAVNTVSSGATGDPVRIGVPLEVIGYRAAETLFIDNADVVGRPWATWKDASIKSLLRYAKIGMPPVKVFSTVGFRWNREGLQYIVLLYVTLLASRLAGQPIPRPEVVPTNQAVRVARWLAKKVSEGTPAVLSGRMTTAVRICLAAEQHGLDIRGTLFQMSGEPFTAAKARVLADAGVSATVRYASSEMPLVGLSCGQPEDDDDVHLLELKLAMLHRDHVTPAGDAVQALIFTSLLPSNPKILINLFSGDYAKVTRRECDCALGRMGMKTHLSGIRSYEKLTGEGVTFLGGQLYDLVENVLPSRFGGHVTDYQLVEEESEDGLPKLSIVVSPRVGTVDEAAVIRTVLDNLQATHHRGGGELMAAIWSQGETLRVVRREPDELNEKIAPLRLRPRSPEPIADGSSVPVGQR